MVREHWRAAKQGFWLYDKVLEKGRFPWPNVGDGAVRLTSAQLAMLWEGIDWRRPDWGAPLARALVIYPSECPCSYGVSTWLMVVNRMSVATGNLPDDPALLKTMIAALQTENAKISATLRAHDPLIQTSR